MVTLLATMKLRLTEVAVPCSGYAIRLMFNQKAEQSEWSTAGVRAVWIQGRIHQLAQDVNSLKPENYNNVNVIDPDCSVSQVGVSYPRVYDRLRTGSASQVY